MNNFISGIATGIGLSLGAYVLSRYLKTVKNESGEYEEYEESDENREYADISDVVNETLDVDPNWLWKDESITFKTKKEAMNVLDKLKANLMLNGLVNVYELYSTIGIDTPEEARHRCWISLDSASVIKADNKQWTIQFPVPIETKEA